MTVKKEKSFQENDNFGFIIFESSNGKYYGFDLGDDNERERAFDIIGDEDDFTVIGWKVAREIKYIIPTYKYTNVHTYVHTYIGRFYVHVRTYICRFYVL